MKKQGLVLALLLGCILVVNVAGCGGSDTTVDVSETTTSLEATTTTAEPTTTTTVAPTGPPIHWAKLEAGGEPSVRVGHAMVFDPITGKTILFGGHGESGGGSFGDLYAYDSVARSWTELHPSGNRPAAHNGCAMVYEPTTGKVLLFNGPTSEGRTSDFWAYDPSANTWTQLFPDGDAPSADRPQSMVYDPNTGKVILFKGPMSPVETWAYDPEANSWAELHPGGEAPSGHSGCPVVYDSATGRVILFESLYKLEPDDDGSVRLDHHLPGSLYAYDPIANSWEKLDPRGNVVVGRDDPAMVYHPGSGLVVLFGGLSYADSGPYANPAIETYPYTLMAYDSNTNAWEKLDQPDRIPYGRTGHAMVYDSKTGEIIMFGGWSEEHGYLSGTWILTP